MRPFLLAFLTLAVAGCSTNKDATPEVQSKLTRANYDAIQNNMVRGQVINLIGEPDTCREQTGTETDSAGTYTLSVEMCWWGNQTNSTTIPYATITFTDGVVSKKEMGNLK